MAILKKNLNIILLALVSLSLTWLIGAHQPTHEYLVGKIALPLQFKARKALEKSPKFNSKIKIIAMDDNSVKALNTNSLALEDWPQLLSAIDRQKPKAILIDKIFAGIPDTDKANKYDNQKASKDYIDFVKDNVSTIAKIKTPIYTGITKTNSPITKRQTITRLKPEWFQFNESSNIGRDTSINYLYGAVPQMLGAFDGAGHISFGDNGYIQPYTVSAGYIAPHLALKLSSVEIRGKDFFVDSTKVPLTRFGKMPVNFLDAQPPKENLIAMQTIITSIKNKNLHNYIQKDDVILILPTYYTGSGDFYETPVGLINGGLYLAAILNSAKNKDWIKTLPFEVFLSLLSLFIVLSAIYFKPKIFVLVIASSTFWLIYTGFFFFAYFSLDIPWFLGSINLMLSGVLIGNHKFHTLAKQQLMTKLALGQAIPFFRLEKMLKNPQLIDLKPRKQKLTVMFIDIAGFSALTKNKSAEETFELTSTILKQITSKIHQYDGIIDKSLGDGILAYFGYSFSDEQSQTDHATRAIECAMDIQKTRALQALKNKSAKDHYSFRIGINTDVVAVGNIGDQKRIDVTLLGNGVNFAQRLEAACKNFRVLVSDTTLSELNEGFLNKTRKFKKLIKIKHQKELEASYEFDCFFRNAQGDFDYEKLDELFLKTNGKKLDSQRYEAETIGINIFTSYGRSKLMCFCEERVRISSNQYLGNGLHLECTIESQSKYLNQNLSRISAQEFIGIIKDSKQSVDESGKIIFVYDLDIVGKTKTQKKALFEILKQQHDNSIFAKTAKKVV